MSPAFLNRFDIITLEDQIKHIYSLMNSESDFLELINTMLKQHCFNYLSEKQSNNNIIENKDNKYDKYIDFSDFDMEPEPTQIEFKYEKNELLNKSIYKKISKNILEENLSIYKLSLFCRAVYIFTQELAPQNEISLKKLVNYAYNLTISSNIEDDQTIENLIYEKYLNCTPDSSIDNKYFFQDSPKLKSFMAKLLND